MKTIPTEKHFLLSTTKHFNYHFLLGTHNIKYVEQQV